MVEVNENLTLGAHDTRDGVGIMGRRTQRPIVTPAEIQSLPQFTAFFRPAYDAPTAKVEFKPVKTEQKTNKMVPYHGGGFDHGGMRLDALKTDLSEGEAPTEGFAAEEPEAQRRAFMRWVKRVRPDALEGFESEGNLWERLSYWKHYASERVRGLSDDEIFRPDPYESMTLARPGQRKKERERIELPYPSEKMGVASLETTPGSPPGAAQSPDTDYRTGGNGTSDEAQTRIDGTQDAIQAGCSRFREPQAVAPSNWPLRRAQTMMSISNVSAGAAASGYYKEEGYYKSGSPEAEGSTQWFGKAAAEIGLTGPVADQQFAAFLEGPGPRWQTHGPLGRWVNASTAPALI